MTNPNASLIVVVLDRSGSMTTVRNETITGFNSFLADRCKDPGDVRMTLVRFDSEYEQVYHNTKVQDVRPLDQHTFEPRGFTALLDAVGKTVTDVGESLAKLPEHERPGKVCMVVITDGAENASKEYTSLTLIQDMVARQRTKYNWEFVFLGASLDAVSVASSMGMSNRSTSMAYTANGSGMLRAFNATSRMVGAASAGATYQSMAYSDQDRAENAPQIGTPHQIVPPAVL